MNFGHKIVLGYSLFILFIGVLVFMSFKQNYQLEEKNYYEKELLFEDEIQAEKNYHLINGETQISSNQEFKIVLPKEFSFSKTKVKVQLKRPSDNQLDRQYEWELNQQNQIVLPIKDFVTGVYLLNISFNLNNTPYQYKSKIYLNKNK